MALSTTLYRVKIDLTDIDRGVYENLDFRLAQHPSESTQYLLTRALAYALNYSSDLEFSPKGLGDPESPALQIQSSNGVTLSIEIGNPSAKRLHKISKHSQRVRIYTYKDPELLINEARTANIHRADTIEIFAIDPKFLDSLGQNLARAIQWNLIVQDGMLNLNGEETEIQKRKI